MRISSRLLASRRRSQGLKLARKLMLTCLFRCSARDPHLLSFPSNGLKTSAPKVAFFFSGGISPNQSTASVTFHARFPTHQAKFPHCQKGAVARPTNRKSFGANSCPDLLVISYVARLRSSACRFTKKVGPPSYCSAGPYVAQL